MFNSKVTVRRRGVQVWCTGSSDPWNLGQEAPPCDPESNNLMQKEWSKVISMLVDMETEDGLKRGAIMVVTKKLAWHVQTNSTIKLNILVYLFCYVLLWFLYTMVRWT